MHFIKSGLFFTTIVISGQSWSSNSNRNAASSLPSHGDHWASSSQTSFKKFKIRSQDPFQAGQQKPPKPHKLMRNPPESMMNYLPRILVPESAIYLPIYGPSMYNIHKIQLLPPIGTIKTTPAPTSRSKFTSFFSIGNFTVRNDGHHIQTTSSPTSLSLPQQLPVVVNNNNNNNQQLNNNRLHNNDVSVPRFKPIHNSQVTHVAPPTVRPTTTTTTTTTSTTTTPRPFFGPERAFIGPLPKPFKVPAVPKPLPRPIINDRTLNNNINNFTVHDALRNTLRLENEFNEEQEFDILRNSGHDSQLIKPQLPTPPRAIEPVVEQPVDHSDWNFERRREPQPQQPEVQVRKPKMMKIKPKQFARPVTTSTTTTTTTTTTARPSRRLNRNQSRASDSDAQQVTRQSRRRKGKKQNSSQHPSNRVSLADAAQSCSASKCRLPNCNCASSNIPGGLEPTQIPQLVMITFDDSVNDLNWDIYREIFEGRTNPNQCPILGTFYVSHEWTDYSQVQNLYSEGHEMASHTITHSHGEKFTKEKWFKEVHGQKEILYMYGGVAYEDVRGMRAPFLQPGGNIQFEMLHDANFTYDSSLPVHENNPPFWPYTFDYAIGHQCAIPPCPTKSYPGLWEVGMVMLNDYRGGRCSMVDACHHPGTEQEIFDNLLKNFHRHYDSNRAPFGLYFHSAWFNTQHYRKGFMRFLEHINSLNDVYFVTKWQMLQWMQSPTPLNRIHNFKPFQCDYSYRQACPRPNICQAKFRDGPRMLKTCQPCPRVYPWVGATGFDSDMLKK